jgi:tetratricopeptide (TPR) repeat protein
MGGKIGPKMVTGLGIHLAVELSIMAWKVDPERQLQRCLRRSEGYLGLGMLREAWEEIESLPDLLRARPDTLILMTRLLHACGRWRETIELSMVGTDAYPNIFEFYFLRAAACEAKGRPDQAKEVLLNAPRSLRQTDLFHYNLARYEANLGNLDIARRELKQAIRINQKLREAAKADPIFQSLKGG